MPKAYLLEITTPDKGRTFNREEDMLHKAATTATHYEWDFFSVRIWRVVKGVKSHLEYETPATLARYRVIAWSPEDGKSYNAGLCMADSPESAIKAAERNRPHGDRMVLEAVKVA